MSGTYELDQAVGANARIIMAKESDWGVASATSNYKQLNVLPGETLDIGLATYRSNVVRQDHMRNKSVRGTQRPGGGLPLELGPRGVSQLLYSALGNKTSTTGAGPYVHVLKGLTASNKLPMFSLEKGFLDLATPTYYQFLGCRVNAFSIDFNIDAIPLVNFDILCRQLVESTTTILSGSATDQTYDPFTSVQVTVYEGSSLTALGTCEQLTLTVANNLDGGSFALGSNYRKNLLLGQRMVGVSGVFKFTDTSLYDKAISGTDTKVQISVSDGTYGMDFLLPNVDLYPNGSTPKITREGALSIPLIGEAAKDGTEGTDIKVTITSPESTIDS